MTTIGSFQGQVPGAAGRGEYVVRNAYVLSMDPAVGELPVGDVHIRDGVIVAVGRGLAAPQAEAIDGSDCVAMPGFVDVHWHMWNGILRGMAHDAVQYFALQRLGAFYTADDHYTAIRYAALEAVNAGITTCHNWANALRTFADAEAEMQALVDCGVRSCFGYGDAWPLVQQPLDPLDLSRAQQWQHDHGDGRLTLGIAIHNAEALATEVQTARELGLATIVTHADYSAHADLVGPDFLFTHGAGASPQMIAFVASTGMKVGLCPTTDPLIGAGLPPLFELLEGGVRFEDIGFSVDVSCQTPVDPFTAMRSLLHAARIAQRGDSSFEQVLAEDLFGNGPAVPLMRPRRVIELATLNGARVLGIDHITGSLTPGKRADFILVRLDQLNMLPASDTNPTFQIVQHAQPSNVDTVIADGRLLKRDGRLLNVDTSDLIRAASATQRDIRQRAALPPLDLSE